MVSILGSEAGERARQGLRLGEGFEDCLIGAFEGFVFVSVALANRIS